MNISDKLAHDLSHAPLEVHLGRAPVPLRALVAEAIMAREDCGMMDAVHRADALVRVAVSKALDGAMRDRFREIVTEKNNHGQEPRDAG